MVRMFQWHLEEKQGLCESAKVDLISSGTRELKKRLEIF